MVLEGKHKCNSCGFEIEWAYQVPQSISGSRLFDVNTISTNKAGLYRIGNTEERNGYKIPLDASLYCPECGNLNFIQIEQKEP
jgi:hypothetical protein